MVFNQAIGFVKISSRRGCNKPTAIYDWRFGLSLPPQQQLHNFLDQFSKKQIEEEYLSLYDSEQRFRRIFAWLHEQYNNAFQFLNDKAPRGTAGHFNADYSRALIKVNDTYFDLMRIASKAGVQIKTKAEYQKVIGSSRNWLVSSGGSPIPEGLTPIGIEYYDTVFEAEESGIALAGTAQAQLQLIGTGAYAVVHKFIDPNYGIPIARKKLRSGSSPKEIMRFRKEYEIMKRFDFPYILKVYRYNESNNSYTMEYCEHTLENYISHNNQSMSYRTRHKMAMQFLYAMNVLHKNRVYHRDLSYKNILIHTYTNSAFMVKISDFGLAKEEDSNLTSTGSAMKGSIKDPALESFQDFTAVNDIYAIGFILSYIFTGRKRLFIDKSKLSSIIQKCSLNNPKNRFQNVNDIIREMKGMEDAQVTQQPTQ